MLSSQQTSLLAQLRTIGLSLDNPVSAKEVETFYLILADSLKSSNESAHKNLQLKYKLRDKLSILRKSIKNSSVANRKVRSSLEEIVNELTPKKLKDIKLNFLTFPNT